MRQVRYGSDAVTLLASTTATVTAGVTTSAVTMPFTDAIAFTLDVTAGQTDATDTLDVAVQTTIDGSTWLTVVQFTQIAGNAADKTYIEKISRTAAEAGFEIATALSAGEVRNLIGDTWRVSYVVAETNDASFTFSVTAMPM